MTTVDTEVQTQQKERTKRGPKEPGRFAVIFHNDDMTPMEFVMQVLEAIFHHNHEKATELTIKVHNDGRAAVGVYSLEVAEQKSGETITIARNNGFPLAVTVEPE
jgi:ATP-dependent Clp protease adaptor protein ClpS